MTQAAVIAKFQVIGASVKMQTVSWDEQIELIGGIPYNIDFYQDFSAIAFKGQPITGTPLPYIFDFLLNTNQAEEHSFSHDHSNCLTTQELKELLEKAEKEDKKFEKKWKKNKPKREKTLKRLVKWIDGCDKHLKKRW